MDKKEKFTKALNTDTDFAWYTPYIGSAECANRTKAPKYEVIEGFIVGGAFCNNDIFILESLHILTFATQGFIRDVMVLLKKQGEEVNPIEIDGITSRLESFVKTGLVFKFEYNTVDNKCRTFYSLTSFGLSAWKKLREKQFKKYDMQYNVCNRAQKMMMLSSACVAVAYAKMVVKGIPTIKSNSLIAFPDAPLKEYYHHCVRTEAPGMVRSLYFETVFLRADDVITAKERREIFLRRIRLFPKLFNEVEPDVDSKSKLVLVVENKAMLDSVVKILYCNEGPDIFEHIWFTTTRVVAALKPEIPFILIDPNSIEDDGKQVSYRIGWVDDLTFF